MKRLIENLESKIKTNDRSIPKIHTEKINLESRKREKERILQDFEDMDVDMLESNHKLTETSKYDNDYLDSDILHNELTLESDAIKLDLGENDIIPEYKVHKSGKLINPLGHWINNGYNETRKNYEDVFRKQIDLPPVGTEKDWNKTINKKIAGIKRKCETDPEEYHAAYHKIRRAELERELHGKKRKVEILTENTEKKWQKN